MTPLLLLALITPPTFYKDILPILQAHCLVCHRPGQIGPMSLATYTQAQPFAAKMVAMTAARAMPPWFADPSVGHFADDPSLTPAQLATFAAWARAGAPAGPRPTSTSSLAAASVWNIPKPDLIVRMPRPVSIPAHGTIPYTYEIVPTGFTTDHWVIASQLRPSSPAHVHHAVIYVRPPGSTWMPQAALNTPLIAAHPGALWTDSDLLLVYAPGSSPDHWTPGLAKLIPAGSDLVFQMHYTTNGEAAADQSSLGLVFAAAPPQQRVLTLQLTNDQFVIPPGAPNVRVEAHGTLPNDCILLSFFPHMHLRGTRFEYNLLHPDGTIEPLLRVHYNFFWQLSYQLAQPRLLKAGTLLQAVGYYDNSAGNPHNPDPTVAVHWGDQTSDEMMVGFFDVAVPATMTKAKFFIRH